MALFRELGTDKTANVIILTGEGDAFCAGGDIEHMDDQFEKHEEGHPGLFRDAADLVNAILKVRQPIIAQVNGDAIGLGASLAVLSDIVMMSSTARIGDPHVRAGLVPGDGGLIAWPLLLPLNLAKELLFTGRRPVSRRSAGTRPRQSRRLTGRSRVRGKEAGHIIGLFPTACIAVH